mmetsp:Transcript_9926/g.26244  ORF Transcript_9926/g.26244 Transcript_9926/m.26244 type:complete len:239 (-) Transcript_9926:97-813(-)
MQLLPWLAALPFALGAGCIGPAGSPCACTGLSPNNKYYLTRFDGKSCSCGPCHAYGEYFTADRQRFGCGTGLYVCKGTACVKTRVVDYGPACPVEDLAGGPVLDASPAVCLALTGGRSCGWSDRFEVSVATAADEDGRPYGPFNATEEELARVLSGTSQKGSVHKATASNATDFKKRPFNCAKLAYDFCCGVGIPCDCSKGVISPGQCKPESYLYCCNVGTPCDCAQPPAQDEPLVVV